MVTATLGSWWEDLIRVGLDIVAPGSGEAVFAVKDAVGGKNVVIQLPIACKPGYDYCKQVYDSGDAFNACFERTKQACLTRQQYEQQQQALYRALATQAAAATPTPLYQQPVVVAGAVGLGAVAVLALVLALR